MGWYFPGKIGEFSVQKGLVVTRVGKKIKDHPCSPQDFTDSGKENSGTVDG